MPRIARRLGVMAVCTLAREFIMNRIFTHSLFVMLYATVALTVDSSPGHAFPSFGPGVDSTCHAYNGTTPYADQGCALCHTSGASPDKNLTPAEIGRAHV